MKGQFVCVAETEKDGKYKAVFKFDKDSMKLA